MTLTSRHALLALCAAVAAPALAQDARPAKKLEAVSCGKLKKLTRLGSVYLAGQPGKAELKELKDKHKIKLVINLRTPPELRFDEQSFVEKELKLRYVSLPFGGSVPLTDKIIERFRTLIKAEKDSAILVHCASANRVGALWLVVRVLDQKQDLEEAIKEAKKVGLRSPGLLAKARAYIDAHQP